MIRRKYKDDLQVISGCLDRPNIHFEDGNGRIARALTEKSIAQGIGQPALISLYRKPLLLMPQVI
ncbi:hypothetical protein [Winogradskyella vidalii]|uniref:hypothetical protein n=1 Tax=Winogradskyella vidalii TaxID=2615024 RepID=UPI0015CD2AD6|nr:hypothetical protein [Winogradskyella vidalii]